MQITRLRLAGFKSFVDPADLRIEPGLTGIVGPNGCGKSNLLEALRWTMGESSARSLRGAGMEDVIFAGTATRPPRQFAEVSLLAEIDGDEREVMRRIERGAGSAYRIDGRDVRARDVALLFADAATGAHSPALVSQGRISAVIAAKPADRRAMLEDAAGIAGLHVRRREAETRLRATEANLARLDEMIADGEARMAALRRQARAAERYRLVSAEVRVAEARLIFARWRDAAAAADAARRDAAAIEAQLADAATAERSAAAYRERAVETVAAARTAAQAARDRASDAGHRLAALRTEHKAAESRLAELADAARRIAADRAREEALAHDAAAALARLAEETGRLQDTVAQDAAAMPALDAAQAESERRARDAEVALAQALTRQAGDVADRRIAAAARDAAEARLHRAARDVAAIAGAAAALADPADLTAARDAAAAARRGASADIEKARAALAWADELEAEARGARDPADAARAAARADLAACDAEAAALARMATPTDGRLAEAVSVVPGFERALAAALGEDMEAPVAAWRGAQPMADDPPAPVGTLPLGERVTAPAALGRRLAQVFLAEIDSGQVLRVGQRLVTREGALRRWDGFATDTTGAAAAERLERANRVAALATQRPALAAAVERAETAHAQIDKRIARARSAATGARGLLAAGETADREAARAEDRAIAALERLDAQRADLATRRQRADADHDAAARDAAEAATALAALPDGRDAAATVATLQGDADRARADVATARATRTMRERTLAATRERLAANTAEAKGWKARSGEAARRIADMDRRDAGIARDTARLAPEPATLAATIAALATDHDAARASADILAATERDADAALRSTEATLRTAAEALVLAREARAGALARVEHAELRRVEMGRLSGERFECPAPVLPERLAFDGAAVRTPAEESVAHDRVIAERERIGPVNLVAEQDLATLTAAGAGHAADRADLGTAVERLRGSIGLLNREGRQRLRAAFAAVDTHFRRLFTTLFDGGQAHLELVDSDDPLEAGLEIMAQPPGKRLQSLTLLSGGEQALTAVALIFALFLTNPAPICVLDEVDAPLDDANVERFCDLLDRMTRETRTRYLIVTHNAVTMSRMHRLFGVTMIERGVSRLVSVDLQAAETLLAAE